jgi:hypothetical protein
LAGVLLAGGTGESDVGATAVAIWVDAEEIGLATSSDGGVVGVVELLECVNKSINAVDSL